MEAFKKIVILVFTVLLSMSVIAQKYRDKHDLGEKYQAQKVAYITNALDLTAEESAAFWPVYNEHDRQMRSLKTKMHDYRSNLLNKDEVTEKQATEAIRFIQKHLTDMNDLEIEYQNKYLEILPAKKVLLLMKAEKDFRRELLRRLGEKRGKNR